MIYTMNVREDGRSIFSYDLLDAPGFDLGRQFSSALQTFRHHFGRPVFDDGLSMNISKKQ